MWVRSVHFVIAPTEKEERACPPHPALLGHDASGEERSTSEERKKGNKLLPPPPRTKLSTKSRRMMMRTVVVPRTVSAIKLQLLKSFAMIGEECFLANAEYWNRFHPPCWGRVGQTLRINHCPWGCIQSSDDNHLRPERERGDMVVRSRFMVICVSSLAKKLDSCILVEE